MIKITNNLNKMLVKTAAKPDVEKMLNMDSFGGLYVDTLPIGDILGFSVNSRAQRAGRATAMAEALGKDPGFLVNYPKTTDFLGALGGGLIGAGTGHLGSRTFDSNPTLGTIAGGIGGGLLGYLLTGLLRRGEMKDIADAYDKAPASKIKPKDHNPSSFDIFGGAHNKGRQRAIAAMLGLDSDPSDYSGFDIVSGPVSTITNALSSPAVGEIIAGLVQNRNARDLRGKNLTKLK